VTRIPGQNRRKQSGFSLIELVVVILIILIVAGIVIPSLMQTWYDLELRAAGSSVSDLMQQDRILSAKNNQTYPMRYRVYQGVTEAFIDLNADGVWQTGEPIVELPRRIAAASGAPSGGSGVPTAYVLPGDTTTGTPFDNSNTMAFSPRGLPCNYVSAATCSTPAPTYFVYYFQDNRPNGWCAVVVTKAGRSKALVWNGTSWH
jgi:prepilin-type N-terminal cleavage/methylation domain-containing protein